MSAPRFSSNTRRNLFLAASALAIQLWAGGAGANCTIVSGNPESVPDASLTVDANGVTITHTTTSLVWKKCVQGASGSDCSSGTPTRYSWQDALKQAVSDSTDGKSDWRLPSRNELMSLVETGCASNMGNSTRFPSAPASATYWTSTPMGAGSPTSAWAVRFVDGSLRAAEKSSLNYVRLVRSGGAHDVFNRLTTPPTGGPSNALPWFTAQTNVATSAAIASNIVTLAGVTGNLPISIDGGQYRINGGAWTSDAGTVANGNTVQAQLVSASSGGLTKLATVTINGRASSFSVSTSEPTPFAFTAQTEVAKSATINSESVVVTGLTASRAISISGGTGGKYRTSANGIDWSAWTASSGSITNNTVVQVQQTSSASNNTATTTNLSINGQVFPFTVTTMAVAEEPADISFFSKSNVYLGAVVNSAAVQVTGLTASRAISIAGASGKYRTSADGSNWSAWTSTAGSITNNTWVQVQLTASTSARTAATTTLTINARAFTFTATTGAQEEMPGPIYFEEVYDAATGSDVTSNTATISGLTASRAVTVTSGTYSKNGAAFTGTGGTVVSGDTVAVKVTAPSCAYQSTTANLTVSGYSYPFTVWTGDGPIPGPFTFPPKLDQCMNTVVQSAASPALSCIGAGGVPISVSGGQYRINAGAYTATAGTVNNGNTVNAQLTSSASPNTTTTVNLNINGTNFPFSVTTTSQSPAPFTFADVVDVCPSAASVTSAVSPALSCMTGSPAISISGGTGAQYLKNGGTWTSTNGTVTNGNTVTVRQNAPASLNASATTTLTINGNTFPFTVRTKTVDPAPGSLVFATKTAAANATNVTSDTLTVDSCATRGISISGEGNPEFSINGSLTWQTTASTGVTIADGNTIRIRLDAGAAGTTRTATLTINGVPFTYSVTVP